MLVILTRFIFYKDVKYVCDFSILYFLWNINELEHFEYNS